MMLASTDVSGLHDQTGGVVNIIHVLAFHIVVCGLDSVVARRWMNGMLVSHHMIYHLITWNQPCKTLVYLHTTNFSTVDMKLLEYYSYHTQKPSFM